ncbi:MAG: ATP-binding protein [Planctomycetes bacterium]|nr:ATP-binding protein [Planctomycetota bacterium]
MKPIRDVDSDEFRSLLRWAGSRENHRELFESILGCPFEAILALEKVYPARQASLVAVGLEELGQGCAQKKFLAGPKFSYQPVHHEIELGDERTVSAMIVGSVHLRKDGKDFIVNVAFENPDFGAVRVSFRQEHREEAREFLEALDRWIEENNFYRGRVVTPTLEFVRFPRAGWEDIVLPPAVLEEVHEHIVRWAERLEEFQSYGLPARRGILLCGEPGTGKTLLGRILASTLGLTFLWVTPRYMLRSQAAQAIYEVARELAPTLVFFEDVDFFAMDRSENHGAVLPELLNVLDGLVPNEGVLTVMTTSHPDALDAALRDRPGRLDRKISLPRPDVTGRMDMLGRFLRETGPLDATLGDAGLSKLASAAEGLNGAHLREVAILARLEALGPERGVPAGAASPAAGSAAASPARAAGAAVRPAAPTGEARGPAAGTASAEAPDGRGAKPGLAGAPEPAEEPPPTPPPPPPPITLAHAEIALSQVLRSRQATLGFGGRDEEPPRPRALGGFGARTTVETKDEAATRPAPGLEPWDGRGSGHGP